MRDISVYNDGITVVRLGDNISPIRPNPVLKDTPRTVVSIVKEGVINYLFTNSIGESDIREALSKEFRLVTRDKNGENYE